MEEQEFYINQQVRKKGSNEKKFKIVGILEEFGIVFYYLKEVREGDQIDPSDPITIVKYERLIKL